MERKNRIWTSEEDDKLKMILKSLDPINWEMVATYVGSGRTKQQCKQRWERSLDPRIKNSLWTENEREQLIQLVELHGVHNWKLISSFIEGRTDNQCRYQYKSFLAKKSLESNHHPIPCPTSIFFDGIDYCFPQSHSDNAIDTIFNDFTGNY